MNFDVVIIGGGPAGMSSAIASAQNGSRVLLVERNEALGGVLNQCIHSGFGLHYYNEELTGPEFANRLENELKKEKNIEVLINTFVTSIKDNEVTIVNSNGEQKVKAKSIILATGAREKTAANICLTGSRPAGVMTAGTAQKMVNIMGKLPGKDIVILGSGDIGLIMARRLVLEGANVKAVLEINPVTSGLRRNVLQCLDDFNIPLLLKTTVFSVVGENKIEGILYGNVDENYNPIKSTEKFMKCDCLILSVGLTPETDLLPDLKIMKATGGAEINEYYMTNIKNVFSAGNVLHIHDLVDNVCLESALAGKYASLSAQGKLSFSSPIEVASGKGISYVVPSVCYKNGEKLIAKFRLKTKITRKNIVAKSGSKVLAKKFMLAGTPGEMVTFEIDKSSAEKQIVVEVEE